MDPLPTACALFHWTFAAPPEFHGNPRKKPLGDSAQHRRAQKAEELASDSTVGGSGLDTLRQTRRVVVGKAANVRGTGCGGKENGRVAGPARGSARQ
jgi:hypothetical protein